MRVLERGGHTRNLEPPFPCVGRYPPVMATTRAPRPPRRKGMLAEALEAARFIWNHPANTGKRARKLAEALMFQARGRLFGRPTIARIGTRSRISVHPGYGQAGLVYANPPEWLELAVWRRTWQPGDLFVDVGANVGAYTIWAIEAGCEVIAIEPNDWAVAQLKANLALNGETAEVIHAAVADRPGSVRMTTGLGVLNRILSEGGQEVRAVTLDDVIGDRQAMVKVDVEGAEMLVVEGAVRALTDRRIKLMQLEWTGASEAFGVSREQIGARLRVLGYELMTPDEDGRLVPVEHEGPQQPDVFARPMP